MEGVSRSTLGVSGMSSSHHHSWAHREVAECYHSPALYKLADSSTRTHDSPTPVRQLSNEGQAATQGTVEGDKPVLGTPESAEGSVPEWGAAPARPGPIRFIFRREVSR
jgi:hypothetical protein